jgi:arginase family enzyme
VKTTAVFFPFDLFGSSGTGAGANLLAEAFEEMLADNRRETVPTRANVYAGKVTCRRFAFETLQSYQDWQEEAQRTVHRAWRSKEFLLWVTGNHLGALPIYEELGRSAKRTLVVQLDAHLDIQNFAECTTEPSHGNFVLHCRPPRPKIINIGNRDLLMPSDYVQRYYQAAFSAQQFTIDPEPALEQVRAAAEGAERVLIDIDCDVLDPAFLPAVTHPLPLGLSPAMLVRVINAAWSDRVVGVAVSEFDPGRDRSDQSLGLLAWLLEYLLLKRYEPDPSL